VNLIRHSGRYHSQIPANTSLRSSGARIRSEKASEKKVVLVVEDAAIIRMGAVQLLRDASFAVPEACKANAALKILESRTDINFVFTDIQIPGSHCGQELAHAAQDRWPPIHLVMASRPMALTRDDFPKMGRFIRRPHAPKELLMALQEHLGPNPALTAISIMSYRTMVR
jgi:CheY-like chemotaxis protein